MVRSTRVFNTSIALAALLAAVALAAPRRVTEIHHATGVLRSLDAEMRILTVATEGGTESLRAVAATRIFDHGTAVDLRRLVPGQRVEVEWVQRDGARIARRIEVIATESSGR